MRPGTPLIENIILTITNSSLLTASYPLLTANFSLTFTPFITTRSSSSQLTYEDPLSYPDGNPGCFIIVRPALA